MGSWSLAAGVPLLVLVVTAFGFLAYALGFLKEYLVGLAVVPVRLWIRFTKTAPGVLQARFLIPSQN